MKRCFVLFISFWSLFSAIAQNPNLTVSSLYGISVDTILQQHLQGAGVVMSGFGNDVFSSNQAGMFNGQTGAVNYPQIGTFNRNGFTDFPFETGLVMTTGNVSAVAGPNNSVSMSAPISNYYTDGSLLQYSNGLITGTASLEFDFIAMSDMFSVNYIFGSEEYCEYVNSVFNDLFFIFLTGVDPVTFETATKIVSVVPGSVTVDNPNGIPVSIGSVNHGYHSSGTDSGANPSNPQFFIHNYSTEGVQFDGYTTALSAQSDILSCQTYHIKVVVANVSDQSLDSGVFLEEGSFCSQMVELEQAWSSEEGGDTLIQGCRDLDLAFKLQRPTISSSTSIIIDTGGDAILGTDYILTKPDGTGVTPEDNTFFYPSGDSVQLFHLEILPTAQFATDTTVKTVCLYVTTQGCDGFPTLGSQFRRIDTVVLHLKSTPDTTEFNVICPDSCYTWNGVDYCESGDYIQTLNGCEVTILHLTITVGLDEYQTVELKVYPSPTSSTLNVECVMDNDQLLNTKVQMLDAYGKLVRTAAGVNGYSPLRTQIDISDLPAGVYFITMVADDRLIAIRKVVKQ